MDHGRHPQEDLTDIEERLRAERPDVTPLELDRIKQTVLNRSNRSSGGSGYGRSKLASVLVGATVMVGGTGLVIAAAGGNGNGNGAGNSQYCPPKSQNPGEPKGPGNNCGKGGNKGGNGGGQGVKGINESGDGNGGGDDGDGTTGSPAGPPVQNAGASTPTPTGESSSPAELTKRQAVREAKRALRKKFGEKFSEAEDRKIDCRREDEGFFLCDVKWSFEDDDYEGTVKVGPPADDPLTRVKVKKK